eukprot:403812-Ditylum_brightwellii.AAC.1
MFYVDDGIFVGPIQANINQAIADLQGRSFKIEEKGTITDYLGINFEWLPDGRLKMSQQHLIQQIIDEVGLAPNLKPQQTPAPSSRILHQDIGAPPFTHHFHYRK